MIKTIGTHMLRKLLSKTALTLLATTSITLPNATLAEEVSFQKEVLPGLIYHCAYCHQSYDRHGYLIIEEENAYSAIVGVPSYQLPTMNRIEPGKPEQSYLWLKGTGKHVEAGGKGWNMPVMSGVYGPFKDTLYNWILQGAKNN